jgi:transmembrane sensor
MKQSQPSSKLNVHVYEAATAWLIEFRTGDSDAHARQRLDEWLRASPDHVRAYLEVSSIWENAALHDAQHKITAEAHVARALTEDNVVALNVAGQRDAGESIETGSRASGRRTSRSFAIAASAAFLCIVAGALAWLHFQRTPTYSTQTGEQRSISLADGSTIQLNARSRVRIRYSADERAVELLAGQVLFQVAKDKQRPFIVRSDDVQVRAVGTQFDVYKKKGGTIITVMEGRIAVSNAYTDRQMDEAPGVASSANAGSIYLSAGQQVSVAVTQVSRPRRIDIAAATAWTQRRLVFDSVPVREVADEFNRYNTRQIVLDGASLQELAIVGVFSSTDPASLLRFLRTQPGINVVEDDARILITQQP